MSDKKKGLGKFLKKNLGKESFLQKTLISKGLPLLANVVTGGAAAPVVNIIKDVVGIDSADPDKIAKAIINHPEKLEELRRYELDNKVELQKLQLQNAQIELEEARAYIGDVQDARDRELEIVRLTGRRDWLQIGLALVVVAGFFILVFMMVKSPLPKGSEAAINQLFGALVAGFSMVLSYFFGSSKGSADKNATIARQNMDDRMRSANQFNNAKG